MILKKEKKKIGEFTLPDLKIYYKGVVIKTECAGIQTNGTE